MKEKITSRVGRIISGGFNALIDAVENSAPEAVMEQAIREVDEVVEEVRAELSTVIANKHLANTRLAQANQKLADYNEKIELAVAESRDDLAEVAISQQLDIEAQVPVLENQLSELGGQEKELEGYIAALQGKKREMREELRLFRESRKATTSESPGAGTQAKSVEHRLDTARGVFDRVLENNTGMGSGTTTADRKTSAALNELEDLARKNRIEERLAAIKGKMKE